MTIDRQLQEQVLGALEREYGIDAAQIGVSVVDGIVTLRGTVPTFRHKWLAERTTRHVKAVRAVANDLEIPRDKDPLSDAAIAQAVADGIEADDTVPPSRVKVTVRHGWVTLTGTTTWHFQRAAAERAAERVAGVRGVSSSIMVEPQVSVSELKVRIEEAFRRTAELDAHRIKIEAHDGTVVLKGTVTSHEERQAAEQAAWAAPGVTRVDDRLTVVP
jgi:osmotically-inducible protein OsmY